MLVISVIFAVAAIAMLVFGLLLLQGKGGSMLSGWNTMNPQKKATFNQPAYLRFQGVLLLVLALSFAASSVGMYFNMSILSLAPLAGAVVVVLGSVYSHYSRRFRLGGVKIPEPPISKGKKIFIAVQAVFVTLILTGVVIMFIFGLSAPNVNISDDSIRITGLYGVTVELSDIEGITLLEQNIAEIRPGMRTNGFAAGNVLRGNFVLGRLFIMDSQTGPVIRIDRSSGAPIFIGFANSDTTRQVYQELKLALPNN